MVRLGSLPYGEAADVARSSGMKKIYSSPMEEHRHQAEVAWQHDPAPDGLRYKTAQLLPIRPARADEQIRRSGKGNGASYEQVVSEWWWI
jgi:hypothetical protein